MSSPYSWVASWPFEADREHGRAQRVLERLPGAEVGGEREDAGQLGRADRLLDLICRRHAGFGIRAVHLESLATDLAAGHQATDRVKKLGVRKLSGQLHRRLIAC